MAHKNGTLKETELIPELVIESTVTEQTISLVEDKPANEAETDNKVQMIAGAPLAEAGRSKLKHLLEKLYESEPVAREGTDPEGVHDMRVATRRLRASLKVLEETVYEPSVTRRFRKDLRLLANALGVTRDSDVFLQHLDEYIQTQPPEQAAELEVMREVLKKRNTQGREEMLDALASKKILNSLERLEEFVNTPGAGVRAVKHEANEVPPLLVKHFLGSAIWKNYEAVLAYDSVMPAPVPTLHRIRVAFKHLRYTINFFEEALPESSKLLVKQITQVQDYLGELNDHQVGVNLATKVLKKHPENVAVQQYQAERLIEIERMAQEFLPLWQKLTGQNFRSRLAGALAHVE